MNVTDGIQRVRDILRDLQGASNQQKEWTDAELLRHLNGALDSMWSEARQADEHWGLQYVTLEDLGATITSIASNFLRVQTQLPVPSIVYIEDVSSGPMHGQEIVPTNHFEAYFYKQDYLWKNELRRGWFPGATDYELFFTETSEAFVASQIRIWHLRKTPRMVRFSATAPTTKTLDVDISQITNLGDIRTDKGYYENAIVECTDNGGSSPERKKFLVSGWSEGTYPKWTMTLGMDHGIASGTSTWEVHSSWPEQYDDMLAYAAVVRALSKGSDREQRAAAYQILAKLRQEFIDGIEQRQFQHGRQVIFQEE